MKRERERDDDEQRLHRNKTEGAKWRRHLQVDQVGGTFIFASIISFSSCPNLIVN